MKFSNLSPSPPEIYTNIKSKNFKEIENFEDYSFREYKYIHPIKSNFPMAPNKVTVDIKDKFYWISPFELFIEKDLFYSKIPMSDVFQHR